MQNFALGGFSCRHREQVMAGVTTSWPRLLVQRP